MGKENIPIIHVRNEMGDVVIDLTDIKRIIKNIMDFKPINYMKVNSLENIAY